MPGPRDFIIREDTSHDSLQHGRFPHPGGIAGPAQAVGRHPFRPPCSFERSPHFLVRAGEDLTYAGIGGVHDPQPKTSSTAVLGRASVGVAGRHQRWMRQRQWEQHHRGTSNRWYADHRSLRHGYPQPGLPRARTADINKNNEENIALVQKAVGSIFDHFPPKHSLEIRRRGGPGPTRVSRLSDAGAASGSLQCVAAVYCNLLPVDEAGCITRQKGNDPAYFFRQSHPA